MPTALANSISAYATVLAGITTLIFCWLVAPQPRRWIMAYAGVLVTGIPTVWYHGFGETFWSGVFDGGTNLLLAWLLQIAALWDSTPRGYVYSSRTRYGIAIASGLVNLVAIAAKLATGSASSKFFPVSFGSFGGFTINELVLITNSLLAVGLLYGQHKFLSAHARPLLYVTTFFFLGGATLASASNHQVDYTILAYHATWHIVGAFGFLFLWAFNHKRFNVNG